MSRAHKEYQRLQAFYEEALHVLAWPEPRLFGVAPAVSAWSPAQQLHHAMAINGQVLESLLKACTGEEQPETEGRANLIGMLVLTTGHIPRGRGRSPRRFVPPPTIARDDVQALIQRTRGILAALEPHLPRFDGLPGRWRHAVFGKLNAQQFLRFARIHSLHHLSIIRDIDHKRPAGTAEHHPQPIL